MTLHLLLIFFIILPPPTFPLSLPYKFSVLYSKFQSNGPFVFSQAFTHLFALELCIPLLLQVDNFLAPIAHVPSTSDGTSQFYGSQYLPPVSVIYFISDIALLLLQIMVSGILFVLLQYFIPLLYSETSICCHTIVLAC